MHMSSLRSERARRACTRGGPAWCTPPFHPHAPQSPCPCLQRAGDVEGLVARIEQELALEHLQTAGGGIGAWNVGRDLEQPCHDEANNTPHSSFQSFAPAW